MYLDIIRKLLKNSSFFLSKVLIPNTMRCFSEKFLLIKFLNFSISKKYCPDNAPSGQMNNVLILLSGSLYLINLLNLFSILLGESLYSNLKFGEITLGNLNEGSWRELSKKDKKYLEKISRK